MSHRHERKEKDCLNCGSIVQGKFCQVCGQENVEPKETFWGMVTHFFNDITHFDGKFFVTLKDLLVKPGFLSAEYIKGRRMSYLHPIRMYVFTSAVFFLLFFSLKNTKTIINIEDNDPFTRSARDSVTRLVRAKLQEDPDNGKLLRQIALLTDSSLALRPSDLLPYEEDFTIMSTMGRRYKSMAEYDSIQKALPAGERDSWLKARWNKKALQLNDKYRDDPTMSVEKMLDILLHKLPYLLFVSLPFFALILKLLYIRRKEFYYADHGIFAVHHYVLSFILLLLIFLWDKMDDLTGWGIWGTLTAITLIAWPVYLYIAMKRFYRQGYLKTFAKFLLLNFLGLIVLVLLFVFFTLFSIFQL